MNGESWIFDDINVPIRKKQLEALDSENVTQKTTIDSYEGKLAVLRKENKVWILMSPGELTQSNFLIGSGR